MRKLFPYILIVLIIVQLLAPFTVGVGVKNNLEVRNNKAEAAAYLFVATNADKTQTKYLPTGVFGGASTKATLEECEAAMADFSNDPVNTGWTITSGCIDKTASQITADARPKPVTDITETVVCNILRSSTWLGCIGKFFYWALYGPTSHILALAGRLLDIAVDYSIKDTSYRSAFVVEGWGVIRDFCNMFFIFILLYIAFGTILKLNGVKTKEMIINVVIIGLLINFSLFATQVIIDASNILTRVFYNSQTMAIGPKGADGVVKGEVGTQGEIKLSEAIMSKTNPQSLILKAKDIGTIQTKYTINDRGDTAVDGQVSGKTFLLVTILAIIINVVAIITFLSCSLIFISRVIGLWLAMIFAPLAFFSYTVPAMQDWDMVGWKKWWPETIKMAFLAPVFVFFLYLIVKFLDTGLGIGINDSKGGLDFLLGIFVPFIFIMILLMKAKEIATKMSGKIGETITKAAKTVGGLALGAAGGVALGLGAGALRGTVGRGMNKLATSEWASTHGAIGRGLGNFGKWAGSGSMDLRGVKIAGKGLSDTGLKGLGKAKEGGYAKHLSDKVEKRQKRAKELEVHESEDLKQNLNAVEKDLQELLRTNSHELETLDKRIKIARENATDLASKARLDPTGTATDPITGATTTNKLAAISAANKLADLKGEKKARKDAGTFTDSTGTVHNFTSNTTTGTATGRSINNLEDIDIPHAHAEIEKENRDRKWAYVKAKSRWGGRANKEAAHKIRMEAKLDSGDKH